VLAPGLKYLEYFLKKLAKILPILIHNNAMDGQKYKYNSYTFSENWSQLQKYISVENVGSIL
jgi:hypothetical protein